MKVLDAERVVSVPAPTDGGDGLLPPAPPTERSTKRWPWLALGLIAVLVLAGGVWWIVDSTVPTSDYEDVVAELDAIEQSLDAAEQALMVSEQDLVDEQASSAELADELEALVVSKADIEQNLETTLRNLDDVRAAELQAKQEFADAQDTIAAYEAGSVGLWTLAFVQGAGLDEEVAACVAEEMVVGEGPAILGVFEQFAISPDAMPPSEFLYVVFDAWEACGLDLAALG